MNKAIFLLGAAMAISAGAAELAPESYYFHDEYELRDAARPGTPELVRGIVSPGLLTETGMGVYRGGGVTLMEQDGLVVPVAGKLKFVHSIRIYGFGDPVRRDARLVTEYRAGKERFEVAVEHRAASSELRVVLGKETLAVPYDALPADFALAADASGAVEYSVTSLSDSQRRSRGLRADFFKATGASEGRTVSLKTELVAANPGESAEIRVDSHYAAVAAPAKKLGTVPAKLEPLKEFDPVKAGWKKVFDDEFDGEKLDESKWVKRRNTDCVRLEDGRLVIDCKLKEDGRTLRTGSINTRLQQTYGYFEARVKFTTENGWWAAFWLYNRSVTNPFLDGFEIDIFEDYYTRRRDAEGKPKNIIDHNLHVYLNATLKSWNYMETLKGSIDDFHVIGCKWTPFEISYYLDGKLIGSSAAHSPWNSVTFDAFNHAAGTAPLYTVVSGQIMDPNASWLKGATEFNPADLPYHYYVDWVRIYEYPDSAEEKPSVRWREAYPSGEYNTVKAGARLDYSVEVTPAAKTGAKVKAVYLFDNGYLLDCRTAAPYDFRIECTKEYFAKTAYLKPGRQKQVPVYDAAHVLLAFAEDENGRIARTTEPVRFYIVDRDGESRPFRGEAAKIPGTIQAPRFDEGGQGVAYSDNTRGNRYGAKDNWRMDEDVDCTPTSMGSVSVGEWLNYTVDIAEEGEYELVFRYGTPEPGPHRLVILCDLKKVLELDLHRQEEKFGWGLRSEARGRLRLPSGRHVLRAAIVDGGFNFATFEFRL